MTPQQEGTRVLRTQESSGGRLETQVRTASGAWVRVHSLYAPEAEASALVDQALNGQPVPPVVAVLGVGLGYVIDEIERRRPDVRVVAFELAPRFLEDWSRRRDWNDLLGRGQLVLGVDPHYEVSVPAWPASAVEGTPLIVVHPVIGQHHPAALARAHKAVQQIFFEQRANADARQRLSGLYLAQTIENLPALAHATDVSALDGIAAGTSVVLCGAGPSLDGQLPLLRAHRDRAWLVALDTALRPLMHAGIVPDLVLSIDPTPLNGRHLIDLPTRARPWLVAEASLDPRAVAVFAGRLFVCRLGRADPWPWLESLDVSPSRLRAWGSVLTAGCDLLSRMGASRVVFAGMDLAYTNGQPYCRGTAFEEDWLAQQVRDGLPSLSAVWDARTAGAVMEPDLHGHATRTSPHMVAFRNWVRTVVAAAPEREFVNATGAGILHGPGIAQAGLPETLSAQPKCHATERTLGAAARRSFDQVVPRLQAGIDALTHLGAASDHAVFRAWAEAVPNFDLDHTRRRLRHAGRRLSAQPKGITVKATPTDWLDVTFEASHFSAQPPLSWRVSEKNVLTYAYRLEGKTMTLAFTISKSAIDIDALSNGIPSNELHLRIPDNYLPARDTTNAIWMGGVAGSECGYGRVHPGHQNVILFRGSENRFAVDPGYFCLFGQLTFEVQ